MSDYSKLIHVQECCFIEMHQHLGALQVKRIVQMVLLLPHFLLVYSVY